MNSLPQTEIVIKPKFFKNTVVDNNNYSKKSQTNS